MFDWTLLVAFVLAASILTITPGLDTAMVLRAALGNSAKVAIAAANGIVLGCLVWGLAVALGLGVILHASEWLYSAVKLAGAGYLMWLGFKLLYQRRAQSLSDKSTPSITVSKAGSAFRQGLTTNLLNPKIGIFYVSFIPQFIPQDANAAVYSFLLAGVHALISLAWFFVLIAAAKQLSGWITQPRIASRLDRISGVIFIGFGIKLALSRP